MRRAEAFYGSNHEGAGCVPKRLCFAIVVAVGLFVLLFIYAGVKLSFGDTSDAKQTKQKIFRIFVGMICAFGAIFFVSLVYKAAGDAFQ